MRNGRCWRHSSRRAARRTRRSTTTCAAPSRRSSGGTTAARSGARSRLRWAPGGWQRRPSAAGRGWAPGSDCWSWHSSAAGWRPGWPSSTAPASGRTTRPQARRKRGDLSRARRAGGARPIARWLWDQSVRDRRCLRARHWFALAPGQAHELPLAPLLLTLLSLIPAWIVADRGYASQAFRDLIWSLGARPAIPAKRNEAPVAGPPWIYLNRNRVERLWSRLKEWRAVATRYEQTACCFMGVLCMAATMDWIK